MTKSADFETGTLLKLALTYVQTPHYCQHLNATHSAPESSMSAKHHRRLQNPGMYQTLHATSAGGLRKSIRCLQRLHKSSQSPLLLLLFLIVILPTGASHEARHVSNCLISALVGLVLVVKVFIWIDEVVERIECTRSWESRLPFWQCRTWQCSYSASTVPKSDTGRKLT